MTRADHTTLRQTDVMDLSRARALQATLGMVPDLEQNDPLPPFFHQIYFWTALPLDQLGRDGHPARGQGVIPDLGLPRRMWAGGNLTFHAPLRLGSPATCETRLIDATRKSGRSGPLGIISIELNYTQNGILCVTEQRDLIYREDADTNAPKPTPDQAPETSAQEEPLAFSTTQLFRYSALTFNGHRIHYDVDYAREIEGYEGLVVHGPLLAQHLILLAQRQLGPMKTFQFRATAPLFHFEQAEACIDGTTLWIRGPNGRMCMQARATV